MTITAKFDSKQTFTYKPRQATVYAYEYMESDRVSKVTKPWKRGYKKDTVVDREAVSRARKAKRAQRRRIEAANAAAA